MVFAICFGGFSLIGVSSGSPVPFHLVVLPFLFVLALLAYGLGPVRSIIRSRQFLTVSPYLCVTLLLAPLGVLLGFGPAHLLAASYFAAVVPIMLIYLGYVLWGRLNYGAGLQAIVAISVMLNFIMAASQMLQAYYGMELYGVSEILQWQYNLKGQLNDSYDIRGRATGVFINPNDFGFWSIMMIGYVWFYFRRPLLKMSFILLLLFCLFASNSRGALSAMLLSTIVIYVSYFRIASIRNARNWVFLSVFVSVLYLGASLLSQFSSLSDQSYVFLSRFSSIWHTITGASLDENLSGRYSAWSSALRIIDEYPFGTFVPPETLFHMATDNQYVYVFLQGGLLFIAVYLWLLLRGAIQFYKSNSQYLYWCTWAILFYGATAYPLNSYSMIFYWVFLGGAIFSGNHRRNLRNA